MRLNKLFYTHFGIEFSQTVQISIFFPKKRLTLDTLISIIRAAATEQLLEIDGYVAQLVRAQHS